MVKYKVSNYSLNRKVNEMYNTLFESILEQWATKKKTKKQLAIVEAAIKLFAEKGYANTSTAEIAKVAEVSEGIQVLNIIVQRIIYYFLLYCLL